MLNKKDLRRLASFKCKKTFTKYHQKIGIGSRPEDKLTTTVYLLRNVKQSNRT